METSRVTTLSRLGSMFLAIIVLIASGPTWASADDDIAEYKNQIRVAERNLQSLRTRAEVLERGGTPKAVTLYRGVGKRGSEELITLTSLDRDSLKKNIHDEKEYLEDLRDDLEDAYKRAEKEDERSFERERIRQQPMCYTVQEQSKGSQWAEVIRAMGMFTGSFGLMMKAKWDADNNARALKYNFRLGRASGVTDAYNPVCLNQSGGIGGMGVNSYGCGGGIGGVMGGGGGVIMGGGGFPGGMIGGGGGGIMMPQMGGGGIMMPQMGIPQMGGIGGFPQMGGGGGFQFQQVNVQPYIQNLQQQQMQMQQYMQQMQAEIQRRQQFYETVNRFGSVAQDAYNQYTGAGQRAQEAINSYYNVLNMGSQFGGGVGMGALGVGATGWGTGGVMGGGYPTPMPTPIYPASGTNFNLGLNLGILK